jgi:hypothetical protein
VEWRPVGRTRTQVRPLISLPLSSSRCCDRHAHSIACRDPDAEFDGLNSRIVSKHAPVVYRGLRVRQFGTFAVPACMHAEFFLGNNGCIANAF